MHNFHRQFVLLLIGSMFIVVSAVKIAGAQDDDDAAVPTGLRPDQENRVLFAEQQRKQLRAAHKAQFDRWFSSQFGTRVGTQLGARERLEEWLEIRLRDLEADCHLREAQLEKLKVAGRGDIKRFTDQVDHIDATINDPNSSIDQLRDVVLDMHSLERPVSGRIFGAGSLLSKTLASTLDPEQADQRDKALQVKNGLRYRAAIRSAVQTLEKTLSLTEEQCDKLLQLLLTETRPPTTFGTAPDVALVLFQASKLPDEKFRSIFDPAQWLIVTRWMRAYIGRASGTTSLEQSGFVFDTEPINRRIQPLKSASQKDVLGKAGTEPR